MNSALKTDTTTCSNKPRLLLFGATFDPPHVGHLNMLECAQAQLTPTHTMVIPCHIPPHKAMPNVSSLQRVEMIRLALHDHNLTDACTISDIELNRQGPSYSVDTITHFANEYADFDIWFLMGMDSLLNFTQWYQWQTILTQCQLAVVQRPGYHLGLESVPEPLRAYINSHIRLLEGQQYDISSSQIRQQMSDNAAQQWLSPSVRQYIVTNRLY